MATSDKTSAGAGEVEEQIKAIRSDVTRLVELIGDLAGNQLDGAKASARDEAERLVQRSKDLAESTQDRAREATETVEAYIKEKPIQSALIALAVGLVLGALTRR